jgi:hypothetical protein
MPGRTSRALCWMLMLTLPLSLSAADLSAVMVQAKGTVMLNGKAGPASVAAFPGDRLETRADSQAMLTRKGATVLLAANSAMTLGSDDLKLHSGSVVVATREGATVNSYTVAPQGEHAARFLVNEEDGVLKIAALENSIVITHPEAGSLHLAAGEVATRSEAAPAAMSARRIDDDKGLIILIAGLVAAGVIVAILNSRDSSPYSP